MASVAERATTSPSSCTSNGVPDASSRTSSWRSSGSAVRSTASCSSTAEGQRSRVVRVSSTSPVRATTCTSWLPQSRASSAAAQWEVVESSGPTCSPSTSSRPPTACAGSWRARKDHGSVGAVRTSSSGATSSSGGQPTTSIAPPAVGGAVRADRTARTAVNVYVPQAVSPGSEKVAELLHVPFSSPGSGATVTTTRRGRRARAYDVVASDGTAVRRTVTSTGRALTCTVRTDWDHLLCSASWATDGPGASTSAIGARTAPGSRVASRSRRCALTPRPSPGGARRRTRARQPRRRRPAHRTRRWRAVAVPARTRGG